jgi:DNA-directed RNA polymerase specialized sigma24 family protein
MKKNWVLSQQSFDALLGWLAPTREQAGEKYEDIRMRLIRIFASRGCYDAEDLADETINRVATKVAGIREEYSGDPALFFYAVANRVHLEYRRKKEPHHPPVFLIDSAELEKRFSCLEKCLDVLTPDNRDLVVQYYQNEKKAKIKQRKQLAVRLGIAPNALRIRACRIRASLLSCVLKCLGEEID